MRRSRVGADGAVGRAIVELRREADAQRKSVLNECMLDRRDLEIFA